VPCCGRELDGLYADAKKAKQEYCHGRTLIDLGEVSIFQKPPTVSGKTQVIARDPRIGIPCEKLTTD
jgi:hypothetical protein